MTQLADAFVDRFLVEPLAAGPLDGTTFAVKDLFDVARRRTGCGNPSWLATHHPADAHAAAVQQLLESGARLIGKTRTDELAYSLDGRNHHEGAPLNPAAPSRLTGGSSSGAASAVAAGSVDFALASDTAGSVRVPAAWCGLLGLRPTHGRVSVQGLAPLAPSFDTVGWMTRSGALLRNVGSVLLRPEGRAGAAQLACDPVLDALGPAEPHATAGHARLDERYPAPRAMDLGIDLAQAAECLRILQAREVWTTHGAWIEAVKPEFGPGVRERFAAARAVSDEEVERARALRRELIAQVDAMLAPGVLLRLPTVPGPAAARDAAPEQLQAQRTRLFPLTVLASLTGRPQLTLPLASVGGAPVGVSLLGWRGGDETLLELAASVIP
jgi:amidase